MVAEESGGWKTRAAPVQVREADLPSSLPPQTGLTFNIWYNKWSQGYSGDARFVNPYKLEPELHAGTTRGDKQGQIYFCIYFSKGMCCMGKKCEYLHHVPDDEDVARLVMKSEVLDCFGREKFAQYREDMGGVGSFRKKNRTLYVGGLLGALNNKTLKPAQVESRIRFVFGKLGQIDRIRYIESKNCAFVKFKHQTNAEFAKESMSNQTLLIPSDKEWDHRREGTGLLVKWANDDPNPAARRMEEEEAKRESLKAMLQLLERQDANAKHALEDANEDKNEQRGKILSSEVLEKLKKRKLASPPASEKPAVALVAYSSSDEE
ncbi:FAFR451W-Ap [Eremothecium gossypii FDAG1]|nr:FAFR451W-Ap [Eremothecium gossypii FDAG1]